MWWAVSIAREPNEEERWSRKASPRLRAEDRRRRDREALRRCAASRSSSTSIPRTTRPAARRRRAGSATPTASSSKRGAVVLGVTPDDETSHVKFKEKYDLPFTLLADPEHASPSSTGPGSRGRTTARRTWASSARRSSSTRRQRGEGDAPREAGHPRRAGARGAPELARGRGYNAGPRGCGGIGRRARFRSVWGQPRGGSSPLIRIANFVRNQGRSKGENREEGCPTATDRPPRPVSRFRSEPRSSRRSSSRRSCCRRVTPGSCPSPLPPRPIAGSFTHRPSRSLHRNLVPLRVMPGTREVVPAVPRDARRRPPGITQSTQRHNPSTRKRTRSTRKRTPRRSTGRLLTRTSSTHQNSTRRSITERASRSADRVSGRTAFGETRLRRLALVPSAIAVRRRAHPARPAAVCGGMGVRQLRRLQRTVEDRHRSQRIASRLGERVRTHRRRDATQRDPACLATVRAAGFARSESRRTPATAPDTSRHAVPDRPADSDGPPRRRAALDRRRRRQPRRRESRRRRCDRRCRPQPDRARGRTVAATRDRRSRTRRPDQRRLSPDLGRSGARGRTSTDGQARKTRYRAVAGPLASTTRLGILAPTDRVDAAASSIRDRILLIGLLLLGAIMLMAYALAPALARARVAQQQRAIAERVLAHVADGVLLLDPQGIVRFWNRAAETITGLTEDRVLGSSADAAIPGWQAAAQQIPIGEATDLDGGAASATVPIEIETRELWLAASGVQFADGTVYTFRDITEDERLDQAKTDFVATVSHGAYAARVGLRGSADASTTFFDARAMASRSAPRAPGRPGQPADHDHRRAPARQPACNTARLAPASRRTRALRRRSDRANGRPGCADACARGDRDRAGHPAVASRRHRRRCPGGSSPHEPRRERREVLAGGRPRRRRARKGRRPDPLRGARPGARHTPGRHERIFQKFYRLDPNLSRGIGGTGLGLYICRELLRRMGGEIHVTSTPGEGSTFSFDLAEATTAERVDEPVGSF